VTSPWFAGCAEAMRGRLRALLLLRGTLPPAVAALGLAGGIWLFGYPIRPTLVLHPVPPLVAPGNDLSAAADFIDSQPWLPAAFRLFNSYTLGGPLAFRLAPRGRILIDSRNEAYGEALNDEILGAFREAEAFRRQIEKRRPDLLVLAWRQLRPAIVEQLGR